MAAVPISASLVLGVRRFWIAIGVVGHTIMIWAVALGVVFAIAPFASLARQQGSG